ncbi:hypothetical protein QPK31_24920 [Massilia sp. YIM B02769]|uniref:hypothetical protein n=1 Tax=Massilia sp. YIM B02769 TaxID=3050129 RepID=UPI0025B7200A|nr:hypothetical protein [Massilia sp. YIM B02769]MDN4061469.1 hypothetical protein [Massilia sp. YIM B02769]
MDIVEYALVQREENPGHGEAEWSVSFVNGVTKDGTIGILGDGGYALMSGERTYFFNSDKVVFLYSRK